MGSERKVYISVLNVAACLSVVFLHANGVFWDFGYERYWITANIIESVFYFAVPIFFMITGCTLIDYHDRYSTKVYFKKRFQKTVLPFLMWSIIAFFYYRKTAGMDYTGLKNLINGIFNTNILSIYWFFIPLFSVYICIPALGMIEKKNRKQVFAYLIITAFILNILMPFICALTGIQMNGQLAAYTSQSYLIYVLIGYYIDQYLVEKCWRKVIYGLGIAGLIAHISGTWLLSYEYGYISGLFKGYLNIPCFFYSVAIFLAFKYANECAWMRRVYPLAKWFGETTFGIYLMHRYLLDAVLHYTGISPYSIYYRIFGAIFVFVVAAAMVKILKRIPIIRYLFP